MYMQQVELTFFNSHNYEAVAKDCHIRLHTAEQVGVNSLAEVNQSWYLRISSQSSDINNRTVITDDNRTKWSSIRLLSLE